MLPILVDAKYLANALSLTSVKAARSLMREWEVPFIYLGPGRGRGLRWEWSAVQEAYKKHVVSPGKPRPETRARKEKKPDLFQFKTAREARMSLTRDQTQPATKGPHVKANGGNQGFHAHLHDHGASS